MNTVNERLIFLLNEGFKGNVSEFARVTGVPQPTLNNIVGNRMSKPSADNLERIINSIEFLDANWLITGKGEVYKTEYNAGRDIKNYSLSDSNNSGFVGENSGSYVAMGDQKAKKIMKNGEIHIDMESSAEIELLRQINESLTNRIKDLEAQIISKDKAYEDLKASKDETIEILKDAIRDLKNK